MHDPTTIAEIGIMLASNLEADKTNRAEVSKKLDGIIKRQDYTNGNVRDLLVWKSFMLGGLAVVTALVIPLIMYVYSNDTHPTRIQNNVSKVGK